MPQVCTYTFHAVAQAVPVDVFLGSQMHNSSPRVPQPEPRSRTWAFLGSRVNQDSTMESVLRGKQPWGISKVKPFNSVSNGASL